LFQGDDEMTSPDVVKQELNERMKIRLTALIAVEQSILPGFCEGMKCDESCPMWSDKFKSHCAWTDFTILMTDIAGISHNYVYNSQPNESSKPIPQQPNRFGQIIE
jgi:hypothetical protein